MSRDIPTFLARLGGGGYELGPDAEAGICEVHLPSTRADTCEGAFTSRVYTALSPNHSPRGRYGLAMSVLSGYPDRGMLSGAWFC